jgi:hypothetical protein
MRLENGTHPSLMVSQLLVVNVVEESATLP